MRLTKVFKSASAAVLLFGTARTTRTSVTSGDQADDTFKRKANKEVKNADDAGAAKLTSNMRTGPGTSPIPPPTSSMAATLVMIDVEEDIDAVEASLGMRGSFAALPRLMMGNDIWGTSSGIATIVATPVSSFYEVSTELVAVDRHEAQDDEEDDGLRWTRFEQRTPTPPDYFLTRFSTTCLYVAHIISADHIRALLYGKRYGRRHHRRRRRRYRRINPNSRRNRRRRRIARVNADLDRTLWGAWTQMTIWIASLFFGDEPEETVTSRASSPVVPNPAAAPVVVPAPAVPVAHWPPVADSSVNLPPASPLAMRTPLETPATPWPPLSPFPPAAALEAAIPLEEFPAAPLLLPPALLVAPLQREHDAETAVGEMAMVPFQAPVAPRPALGRLPPAAALGAAIPLEGLPAVRLLPPALPAAPLQWEPDAAMAMAIVLYEAPGAPRPALGRFPPAAPFGAAIPQEQLAAAPLFPLALADAPLQWEPDAEMAIVLYEAPAAPQPVLGRFPPAAALGAAIPLEGLPATPLLPPAIPAAPLHWAPGAAMAMAIVIYEPRAAPRPVLGRFPPAAALGPAIPLEELPAVPLLLPPARPVEPLQRDPDAEMAIVPYEAQAVPRPALGRFPPAAGLGAAIPLEERLAAPLLIAPLNWEPNEVLAIVPFIAPAALRPALDTFPPAAALGAAIALEQVPAAPLPNVPLQWEPDAEMEMVPFEAPAALLPALGLFPPVPALGAAIPLEQLPVAPLNWDPDAAMAIVPLDAAMDPLADAVNWSSVAKTFAVMDLDESDSMVVPERGWGDAIKADVERFLSVEACPSERVAVWWILAEAVELYPFTGYSQGSDRAALAIYRGMRGDKEAALRVFVQWASPAAWFQRSTIDGQPVQLEKGMRHSWKVLRKQSPTAHTWLGDETMDALYSDIFLSAVRSLCTCQGLPSDVVHCLIQKTLEAGNNGPAVSLWVMHSLLAVAELECRRKMDATPDMCIRTRLTSAGETITSFRDLEQHAPMALSSFVNGYAAAVFGEVRLV